MNWIQAVVHSYICTYLDSYVLLIETNLLTSTFSSLIITFDTQIGESLYLLLFLKGRTAFF